MCRKHQPLEEVDVAHGAELGQQFLPERLDLDLEDFQKRAGRSLIARRKALGAFKQSLEQDLAIAYRSEAHGQPSKLRTQRLRPLRVQKRPESAQVRAQLACRHASLM